MYRHITRILMFSVILAALIGIIPASAIQLIADIPRVPHIPAVAPVPPIPAVTVQPSSASEINLEGVWKFHEDLTSDGFDRGWASPSFNDSAWSNIKVPGDWESQGFTQANPAWAQSDDLHQPYTGYAWYRKSVIIPAEWKGKTVTLKLGKIDDLDWTRVNGHWVGETSDRSNWPSAKQRVYTIPSEVIKWGQPNVIAIRVLDYRGLGGITEGPVSVSVSDGAGGPAVITSSGDAVKIGGSVTVQEGQTVKDAVAVLGNVHVRGHVRGNAVAVLGTVHVYPGATVDGDVTAVAGQVIRDEGSTTNGQVTSVGPGMMWTHGGRDSIFGSALDRSMNFLINLLFALIAVVIVALFPSRMETIAQTSIEKPGWSTVYAIISLLLILPIAIFLLITCIGIPLILVEMLLVFVAWIAGFVGISMALGWKLGDAANKPISNPIVAVLIGAVVLALIELIPFMGSLLTYVLKLIGFGAVLITGFGANRDWVWNRKRNAAGVPPPPSAPAA